MIPVILRARFFRLHLSILCRIYSAFVRLAEAQPFGRLGAPSPPSASRAVAPERRLLAAQVHGLRPARLSAMPLASAPLALAALLLATLAASTAGCRGGPDGSAETSSATTSRAGGEEATAPSGGRKGVAPAPAAAASPAASAAAARRKVLLVGLDGADWKVVQPLLTQGRMPNLARLIRDGASGELQTLRPALSPIIWTTIATGAAPEKHAVLDFWHPAPTGERPLSPEEREHLERLRAVGYIGGPDKPATGPMVLYRSTDRKVRALWNILGERGITCDVLAWWVTYPAETLRGVMVSDRYLYNRFELAARERGLPYEKAAEGLVSPASAEPQMRKLILKVEDVTPADLQRFIRGNVSVHPGLKLHEVEDELRMVYAKDESVARMARALLAQDSARFLAVYIEGTDIACHYFWKYRFPEDWARAYPSDAIPAQELARYAGVIDAYYQLQDENLGTLLAFAGADTTVIVCSDHGFVTGKRPPGAPGAARTVSGVHEDSAPPGILVLAGSGIAKGIRLQGARVHDIAPTILALFGLPPDAGMDGRALNAALQAPPR